MRVLLAAALLVLAAPGAQAQAPRALPAACPRDEIQSEAALRRQQRLMVEGASAPQAEQCKLWREQVGVLQNARAVFARCRLGASREEAVRQMDGELADYRALLADRCRR